MKMSDVTLSKVIAIIVSQVRKIVARESSGIANVSWDDNTHSLVFDLVNGKKVSVALTINASGISYSNEKSKLNATDTQGAIDEIVEKLPIIIQNALSDVARTNEENHFTAINTFAEETQFLKEVDINNHPLMMNNGVIKLTDHSNDRVTILNANGISVEQGNDPEHYELNFPKENGDFVSTQRFDPHHSTLSNEDFGGVKEDSWKTTDIDTTLSIKHQNTTTETNLSVSKNYIEMGSTEHKEAEGTFTSSRISFTSDSATIEVANGGEHRQNITLTSTTATLNNDPFITKKVFDDGQGKKVDKVETSSQYEQVYAVDKDGKQKMLNIEETLSNKSVLITAKVATNEFNKKVDKLTESEVNRVYARVNAGEDTSLPFSYTAERDSIAKRSATGSLAVGAPTQEDDATTKRYVDEQSPKYLELFGENGLLSDEEFDLIQNYGSQLILRRGGVEYRLKVKPLNTSGDYVFTSEVYIDSPYEFALYIIKVSPLTKSWVAKIKNISGSVMFDEPQSLTDEEKEQARINIDTIKAQKAVDTQLRAYTCTSSSSNESCLVSITPRPLAIARFSNSTTLRTAAPKVDLDTINLAYFNQNRVGWKSTLPSDKNGDIDTSKVLFTKVTITDIIGTYTHLIGSSVIMEKYTEDGFTNKMLSTTFNGSPFSFIGNITSHGMYGLFLSSNSISAVDAISENGFSVKFSYEYLW